MLGTASFNFLGSLHSGKTMSFDTTVRRTDRIPHVPKRKGTGTITWSPQAFGLLTGKFDEGVQLLSRGSLKSLSALQDRMNTDDSRNPKDQMKMRELNHLADKLGCSITQLTIDHSQAHDQHIERDREDPRQQAYSSPLAEVTGAEPGPVRGPRLTL
ncbi:voltage-gated potassium channel subunit beta-2 [Trichonephila clavipes]|nr:voltage-gated potassium channel subunit beta-2 [Trichonephila clavipes]